MPINASAQWREVAREKMTRFMEQWDSYCTGLGLECTPWRQVNPKEPEGAFQAAVCAYFFDNPAVDPDKIWIELRAGDTVKFNDIMDHQENWTARWREISPKQATRLAAIEEAPVGGGGKRKRRRKSKKRKDPRTRAAAKERNKGESIIKVMPRSSRKSMRSRKPRIRRPTKRRSTRRKSVKRR